MNEYRPGCVGILGAVSGFFLSPVCYLAAMMVGGWQVGVRTGAVFGFIGLGLMACSLLAQAQWVGLCVNLAWLAVPTFFMSWGSGVPAHDARITAFWVAGVFVVLAGLVKLSQIVNSWSSS